MTKKTRAGLPGCLAMGALISGLALGQEGGAAPSIEHEPVAQAQRGKAVTFTAAIHSGNGVFQPLVYFRHAGAANWTKLPLLPSGGATWAATLPAANVTTDFEYYLETYDNDGNGPARAGSPNEPFQVTVRAAPREIPATPTVAPAASGGTVQTAGEQGGGSLGETIGGIACLAGGLTGIGLGVYGFIEWNQETNYQNAATGSAARATYQSPIQSFLELGAIGSGLGAVATGVGIWLLYAGLSSGPGQGSPPAGAASPAVSIVPVPGGALAGYAGRF